MPLLSHESWWREVSLACVGPSEVGGDLKAEQKCRFVGFPALMGALTAVRENEKGHQCPGALLDIVAHTMSGVAPFGSIPQEGAGDQVWLIASAGHLTDEHLGLGQESSHSPALSPWLTGGSPVPKTVQATLLRIKQLLI
jgi:hypothetical protein